MQYCHVNNIIMIYKYSCINSKIILSSDAKISVQDRGFMFGDGAFETCHINKKILDFDLHIQRLSKTLNLLKINVNLDKIKEDSYRLIGKNKIDQGLLRISISRGEGSAGYLPLEKVTPLIVIQARDISIPDNKELILGVSKDVLLYSRAITSFYKTANSINYILAKIEAKNNQFDDNILLNEKEQICETSSANIFWVKGRAIYTSSLGCGLLNGTKRQRVIQYINNHKDLELIQGEFYLEDLQDCDECFISNSSYLLRNISKIVINKKIINLKGNNIGQYIKENAFN